MAYKPVPMTQKVCVQCNTIYYAKDRRRLYCSSSCNTQAWLARQEQPSQPKTKPGRLAKVELDRSLSNLTTISFSVLAADAVKAAGSAVFLDRQPTNQELLDRMTQLDKDIETALTQLNRGTQYLIDGINALKASNPALTQAYDLILEERMLEQARLANRQDVIDGILTKRKREVNVLGR